MKVTHTALAGLVAAAALVLATSQLSVASAQGAIDGGAPASTDQPLRTLAKRAGLRIGTAVDMAAFADDATYRDRIAEEFSSVTAENAMKWGEVEPERGVYDWTAADQLIRVAEQNNQVVRGHTLVWHNQLPGWLTEGVASNEIGPDELRGILKRHVTTQVRHFRGKVYQWDVANEVIDDNGQLRDSIWLRHLGPGYIADAFRWAHQADPKAKLFLNDYNIDGPNAKADAYYALVKDLRAKRVPVHGLGIQGHLGVQYGFYPAGQVADNLRRFEDLGLETAVTEADVRMIMPPDTAKLQAQAQGYSTLMQGCLLAERCRSFTVWGFTDKYSWIPGWFEGEGAATILDENFAPKPAYDALRADLALAGR
jgi:endo-1,4-beta-xylanase